MERVSPKFPEIIRSYNAPGGHMQYERLIIERQEGAIFAKIHDEKVFTDPVRSQHSQQYLHKEHHMYSHVSRNGYEHVPNGVMMHDTNTLVMDALLENDGWHWKIPHEQSENYINDTFHALSKLRSLPIPDVFHDTLSPTLQIYKNEGWDLIDERSQQELKNKLLLWQQDMQPDFHESAERLLDDLYLLKNNFIEIDEPQELFLCHHDFRQANFAWHPEHGTKIVDWSWAGLGREYSDETSLLIDLHKSGHDVSQYGNMFNHEHAITLTGFWLAHSLWPTKDNTSNVRFHQFTSAVAAYRLLSK